MLFSQFIPPSYYPHCVHKSIGYTCVSLFLPWKLVHQWLFKNWNIVDILYYFHVEYILIWHLNTLKMITDKSSKHLSPCKIITILLTILSMCHITFPWCMYFITGDFSSWSHSPVLFPSHPAYKQTLTCLPNLWFCFQFTLYACVFWFLDSTCKWHHVVFAFV